MEAHGVVIVDEAADEAFGVLKGERGFGARRAFSLRVRWKRLSLPLL